MAETTLQTACVFNTNEYANIDDIDTSVILSVPLAAGILSVIMTFVLAYCRVLSQPRCTPEEKNQLEEDKAKLKSHSAIMQESEEDQVALNQKIANHIESIAISIQKGAESFLYTEYKFMCVFVIIMLIILGLATGEWEDTGVSFLIGAFLSASCGWLGMSIAVQANIRTAHAARSGLDAALKVAFSSGAVMGLGVTGFGILGLVVLYAAWEGVTQEETRYLAGFGFGASSIALFARVGGGIYTKAADVGADLVGKVESNIPEDDPRNPATIADNVGDNVGDVAGMGADLFESFVGSIIAAIQLAPGQARAWMGCMGSTDVAPISDKNIRTLIALPFWIAGFGMICANFGIFLVRSSGNEGAGEHVQEKLLSIIFWATLATGILAAIGAMIACGVLLGWEEDSHGWDLFACNCIGLVAGFLIGQWTEYITSSAYKPTKTIAKKAKFGEAGVVIQGLGIGMLSTIIPVVILVITIISCEELAGTYGVAIAAVGMLSTLGVTLATDAFGPVADNAGGIAEMADLPSAVRDTTDALDALGNTTAATGKGFAIGSAVLTSLALLTAFKQDCGITAIDVSKSEVLAAAIFGACLPYIFAAMTMMAVGRAATMMIGEVRKQFREKNLLGTQPGKKVGIPDHQRCVDISTKASLWEMIIPGTLAVCAPLGIGFILGPEALGGMLVGAITSGMMLAIYMSNTGGAWDNAKKYIEGNGLGKGKGKGSSYHKAAIVGDTIGDPFKDTSGPALNILIKLMTMISLVFGKSVFKGKEAFDEDQWFIGLIIFLVFLGASIGLTLKMRQWGFGRIPDDNATQTIELPEKDFKGQVGYSV